MSDSYFHFGNGNANFTLIFTPPPPPRCACGRGAVAARLPNGSQACAACVEEHNRRIVIANAENWLTAAFLACLPDQRPRLYRALSSVFHPDVGGEEALMQALNAVKVRLGIGHARPA